MNSFSAFLGKKVFGVPLIYIAGLFVAILVVIAWRLKPNMSSTAPGSGDNAGDGTDGGAITSDSNPYDQFRTTGTVTVQQGAEVTTTPVGVRTNDAWARQASEWLGGQGYPSDAAWSAMQLYVSGEQLSIQQGQMRDLAIKQFGYPPEAFTSGGTLQPAPEPTPEPTPDPEPAPEPAAPEPAAAARQGNPPLAHRVMGPNDNTMRKIAALYYGGVPGAATYVLVGNQGNLPQDIDYALPVGTLVKVNRYRENLWTVPRNMTVKDAAAANGVTVNTLCIMNGISSTTALSKGRVLRLP